MGFGFPSLKLMASYSRNNFRSEVFIDLVTNLESDIKISDDEINVGKFNADGDESEVRVLQDVGINTFKYHVFAPMGRFQLESIYLYFPPSSQLLHLCFCPVGLSLL